MRELRDGACSQSRWLRKLISNSNQCAQLIRAHKLINLFIELRILRHLSVLIDFKLALIRHLVKALKNSNARLSGKLSGTGRTLSHRLSDKVNDRGRTLSNRLSGKLNDTGKTLSGRASVSGRRHEQLAHLGLVLFRHVAREFLDRVLGNDRVVASNGEGHTEECANGRRVKGSGEGRIHVVGLSFLRNVTLGSIFRSFGANFARLVLSRVPIA